MTVRREKILVVDDEAAIRTYLRIALSAKGYEIIEAENGVEAVAMVKDCSPDAVLLDMGLPDASGLEVTRNLRSWTWVPIVFISVRDDEQTKVEALDAGADDYVAKPFGLDELLARLRAALRRRLVVPSDDVLVWGLLHLDPAQRVVSVAGQKVSLSPNEFLILQVLMRNPGKLVGHRQILIEVWGPAYSEEIHMLRVNIFNLRKKIERESGTRYILNEPGVGYRLARVDGTP
jgi:two-component system, OmpR family, KDP operon response regulator KdpE